MRHQSFQTILYALMGVALFACTSTKVAQKMTTLTPKIGTFGLDLDGRDMAIAPGDDFFKYAGGKWLASQKIPEDQTSWGSFIKLHEAAQANVREILESAIANKNAAAGSVSQKIGDYYAAYLDRNAIDDKGISMAQDSLKLIRSAATHDDVAKLLASKTLSLPTPIGFGISLDAKNPDRYVVSVRHGGLALPDRDFYLRDDQQFKETRKQYQAHIEKFLELAGENDTAKSAGIILALETEIAKLHWPRAEQRDRDKTYNPKTRKELVALAPAFPWDLSLKTAQLSDVKDVIVAQATAMAPLSKLFKSTPVDSWKRYAIYHYLRTRADVLPKPLEDERFAFFGKVLSGQMEQKPRWKNAVDATSGAIGEGVGELYVKKFFPSTAKAQMQELVENLRRAFGQAIDAAQWMTPETKKVAQEKLAAFRPKIGYPDKWRDYSRLEVRPSDAFGNGERANMFDWQRQLERLGKPSDREEWGMSPQTVNAYYNPAFNEIVFPAAILQPPFFDPQADPAVNYGAIGGVIAHEMGHGFDDQGSKSDARGVLHAWWNETDVEAFKKLGDRLVTQYNAFEPLPGIKVNGRLTLGENISDLGGLTLGYRAYQLSLGSKPAEVLDGVTGAQRFFLSWAQVWRSLHREKALRNKILSGPHSPEMYRVNGVVRNVDEWYEAFGVKPSDKLYMPPEGRVRIW